jgi:iron complex transport system ATP-binding protein
MTPLLRVNNLTVKLGHTTVVDRVSFELTPGSITALIGPNGSGKTSLLRAVLNHVPHVGQIEWLGNALENWSSKQLARRVGYLPQNPTFDASDTVIDTLRLGRSPHQGWLGIERDHDEQVVQSIAQSLELTDLLPRPLGTLSGGQRQRVFLGRALAQEPAALLLDEPATFLDLRHQVELHQLLARIAREQHVGILMASHDLNLVATHADNVLILKSGHCIAAGTTHQAMTSASLSDAFDVPVQRIISGGRTHFIV